MTQNEITSLISRLQRAKPGLQFDLSGNSISDQTVKVKENGSLDQSASQRTAVTLRVWNQEGRLGVVQLTSLADTDLLAAVDVALDAAPLGAAEDIPQLPSASEAGSFLHPSSSTSPEPAAIDALCETLTSGVQQLRAFHPDIQVVPYNALSQRRVERFYANTVGLVRAQVCSSVSTYLYARGQSEGFKPRAAGHWGLESSLNELNISEVAEVAGANLVAHLRPGKIPSGRYPIIFSGSAFLDLLSAFDNLFNAQNILDKQSLHTKDSLNQSIASELLNITDDPLHPLNIAPPFFDGEGTTVSKTVLVEKGCLKGLWHHTLSARAFSTKSTGHARVGAKMSVGPWFYNVAVGEGLGDLAKNCIWIEDLQALHAGVNPLQGSFSLPFQGFWIQSGEKMSLEGVTVAGDILSVLQSISALDVTQERASGGVCPAVAVRELSVTCES